MILRSIHIYPVKSTRGIALDAAEVEPRGLRHDRRWMVVDIDGVFRTQRMHPTLALIETTVAADGGLTLRGPDLSPLRVSVPDGVASPHRVRVWKDTVEVLPAGKAADEWISAHLGVASRLVYLPAASRRPVDPAYGQPGDEVSFADGYPLLLTTTASLADLNTRLQRPVPMDRFRPNLVIEGAAPFAEDGWRRLRIGTMTFRVVKPCARCAITTVDQATAAVGKEPLRTLAAFRRRNGNTYFGQNLIPDGPGQVRTADTVEVLERVAAGVAAEIDR